MYKSLPAPLLLSLLPGVGASRYWEWVEHFGSASLALKADPQIIGKCPDKAKSVLADYHQHGTESQLAQQALSIMAATGAEHAELITIEDAAYPALLKHIHRAPPVLFAKGNTALLHHPQIAIVGTRNPTHVGSENAKAFGRYLAANGFTITSGLALGIDGIAHRASMTEMGSTIAVMATGIDAVYPARHRKLAEDILDNNGLLLTEFTPNTPPLASRFPRRNRIISGLSVGTLVVEAAIKSGSLITAVYANEQNREVFCIPSSIHNPQGKGCHKLIKEGAHLVETASDIVQQCQGVLGNWKNDGEDKTTPTKPTTENLSTEEQQLLDALGYEPKSLETILSHCKLSAEAVNTNLILLELKGMVKQSIWGYERCR